MIDTEFIHYGSSQFDIARFEPIRNGGLTNKPHGGLWASPVSSEYGWRHWCADEDFSDCVDSNSFTFTLSPQTRILIVDTVVDMQKMQTIPFMGSELQMIDFEAMTQSWDAIWLTVSGQSATRFILDHLGNGLYGWDCECILVMNPSVIVTKDSSHD